MVMCPNSSWLDTSTHCWLLSSCLLVMPIPFVIDKEKKGNVYIFLMPLFDHCYKREAKVYQLKEYFKSVLVTLGRQ